MLAGERLLLCLGSRALLALFCSWCRPPLQLVGAATDAETALALLERHQPDLLVTSDALEEGDGMALVLACKTRYPAVRTLLMVSRVHRLLRLREVIDAGCEGVLLEKRIGHGASLTAIRTICSGGIYIDRDLRPIGRPGAIETPSGPLQPLSAREREVLCQMGHGLNTQAIASELVVSVDTVKTHVQHVISKLKARNRCHAVAIGLHLGLLDGPGGWPDQAGHR